MACCEGSRMEVSISSRESFAGWRLDRGDFLGDFLGDSASMRGIGCCLRSAFRACLSFWSLSSEDQLAQWSSPRLRSHMSSLTSYFCICSSNSLILSAFCTFLGFGFFTTTLGGFTSSRLNQLDRSELDENSFRISS